MLTTEKIAQSLTVGTHASTFGGNPVAAAAAVEVLKIMLGEGFLASVREKSRYFIGKLQEVVDRYPQWATGVRGRGLLLGLVLTEQGVAQGMEIVQQMFAEGALINFAGNKVLRFVPPLIVSEAEIDTLVEKLCRVFDRQQ
jgi:acetylornithine aminotransferase/acetylornithine/N-succinyldiaminopimelate aminotransferase